MKKTKQILALIGVILLVALYLSTLVFALIGSSDAMNMFQASVFATIVVPVLLWAYTLVYKLIKNRSDSSDELEEVKKQYNIKKLQDADTDDSNQTK